MFLPVGFLDVSSGDNIPVSQNFRGGFLVAVALRGESFKLLELGALSVSPEPTRERRLFITLGKFLIREIDEVAF